MSANVIPADGFPSYSDLPTVGDTGEHCAWSVFGDEDELGSLNFITAEHVRAAAAEVRLGQVINLDLPVGVPSDIFWANRTAPSRIETRTRTSRDDKLDNFFLQGTTQWDALRHHRFRQYGYYGGRSDADVDGGALGIDRVAKKGIVARGVLIDVLRFAVQTGLEYRPNERFLIGGGLIDRVAEHQDVKLLPGDVLLIRTGWLEWYLAQSPQDIDGMRQEFQRDRGTFRLAGVDPSARTAAWMWDARIAAAATDTPTFDALEYRRQDGWAHQRLLALLGMTIGELWDLDELSATCSRHGKFSFLFTSSPLLVPAGCGSPGNAYAVL
jgi:kynurenine formamidase